MISRSSLVLLRLAAMLAAFSTLGACQRTELKPDPAYAAIRPSAARAPVVNDGAIYRAGWDMRLFEDSRARRVGDILTVTLVETTNATTESTTSTSKSSNIQAANPTLLGTAAQFGVPPSLPFVSTRDLDLSITQSSNQTFNGEGTSEQSNSLSGSISVTVVEVLPNQNLVVRGEKLLNLNRGEEQLRISGIVRPQDISADNVVTSDRMANVGISYAGTGDTSSANVMGWLAKFFMSALMPF